MTPIRHFALLSLFLAAHCWASDPVASDTPAAEQRPRLTLDNPEVRKTLRESARELASDQKAGEIPATKVAATIRLPVVSLRRPVVVECRLFDCLGYDASGKVISTLPPPASPAVLSTDDPDDWYSCQSRYNMLSTFERADTCAGIRTATSIFVR
jgi:hypothetical protein